MLCPRRSATLLFSLTLVGTFFLALKLLSNDEWQSVLRSPPRPGQHGSSPPAQARPSRPSRAPTPVADEDWLAFVAKKHNLSFPLRYTSRTIQLETKADLARASVTRVDKPFLSSFDTVSSADAFPKPASQRPPAFALSVPPSSLRQPDASNLIFGASTTISRLNDSISHFDRWLRHSKARLVVVLIKTEGQLADPEAVELLESSMRADGYDVFLSPPAQTSHVFAQRYFNLIEMMDVRSTPRTEWAVLIDDDTFFPSLPRLLKKLREFDAKEMHYVGALSEDAGSVRMYGEMAFGGAGIFLSQPLASHLAAHRTQCGTSMVSQAGDVTVNDCVSKHTDLKLEVVKGLHQIDLYGDVSGVYESGQDFLSLHHWKTRQGSWPGGMPMADMHLIADLCGDCWAQRWIFGDEWMLVNGISLSRYPKGHLKLDNEESIDLEKVEHTWDGDIDVAHSLGETRRKMVLEEEKVQFVLLDAVKGEKGDVRQIYLHGDLDSESHEVVELVWLPETRSLERRRTKFPA